MLAIARHEALMREEQSALEFGETLAKALWICYRHLRMSGFSPDDSEVALNRITRLALEKFWFEDHKQQ
jgi:hypothetical protein